MYLWVQRDQRPFHKDSHTVTEREREREREREVRFNQYGIIKEDQKYNGGFWGGMVGIRENKRGTVLRNNGMGIESQSLSLSLTLSLYIDGSRPI